MLSKGFVQSVDLETKYITIINSSLWTCRGHVYCPEPNLAERVFEQDENLILTLQLPQTIFHIFQKVFYASVNNDLIGHGNPEFRAYNLDCTNTQDYKRRKQFLGQVYRAGTIVSPQ